jgi:hypothetical protein
MKQADVAGWQRRVLVLLAQAVAIPGKHRLLFCGLGCRKLGSRVNGHRCDGPRQSINSCNIQVYCAVAGTSRKACREIYAGPEPFRAEGAVVWEGVG